MKYTDMTLAQRQEAYAAELARFEGLKSLGLKLNMARGKPGTEQLDLVMDIFNVLPTNADYVSSGIDSRNYGELSGIPEAKALFADILGCKPSQVFVGGNASLQLMYDAIAKAYTHGLKTSPRRWCEEPVVKWLCPAPGYDRHFKVSETFGMELITIPMTATGPDMDMVEEYIKDPAVKGMWNVPKYSNPQGITYSAETVERIASMKPAAPDFMLMWDNAYCIHEFATEFVPFPDIISTCEKYGNGHMCYEFASTSKVTFPGAGVGVMAASEENIAHFNKLMSIQTIGFDKINQLRHVRYLKDKATTLELMKRHAEVLRPKFDAVLHGLDTEIAPLGIAHWERPVGGYFVSLDGMDGTAKRTLALCAEAGVTMTGAGATFPYGVDPRDRNIRIAPTLPPVGELTQAVEVLCTCLKMATLEKLGI